MIEYGFLFAFHSAISLASFPRYSEILAENRYFLYPLYLAPPLGGSAPEYYHTVR